MTRRLLAAMGDSSGADSTTFDVHRLGYWNQQSEPRAVYYNGKTYMVWITQAKTVEIAAWDHTTRSLGPAFTLASGVSSASGDVHNSAAVCIRGDGKIVVAWCGEEASSVSVRISTNAEDVSAFGAPISVGSGGFTYLAMYQLPGAVNTPIYLFSQRGTTTFKLAYAKSIDGGATWSAFTDLISPASTQTTYWRIGTNGSTTFHIYTTDTEATPANPSSVYHFMFAGDTLYNTAGLSLGTTFPVAANAGGLVKNSAQGAVRPLGWSFDSSNRPACILTIYDTVTPTLLIKVARWTGAVWRVDDVADSNGLVLGTPRMSECGIDKSNPDVCYVSKRVGPTYWEVWRYVSPDSGSTWSGTPLTSGSTDHNVNPDTPLNADDLRVLWGYGAGTSLDFVIRGSLV